MNIYKRLLSYLAPYKMKFGLGLFLTVLAGVGESLVAGVIYVTTNGLMNREYVSLENIPHLPENFAVRFPIIWVPFIIVGVFVLKGLLNFSSKYLLAIIGFNTVRDIQNDLYAHVTTLSCDYFTKQRSGDLLSRIARDTNGVRSAITDIVLDALKAPITIIVTVPIVLIMGGRLALICLCVFPIVAFPIIALGRKIKKLTTRLAETDADIASYLTESLNGMRIVKIFNAEPLENSRFRELTERICRFYIKVFRSSELQRPVIEIMGAVGIAITIFFAIKYLPFDRFITFTGSLYILYEPAKKISKINAVIQQALAHGRRIFDVMDTQPAIVDAPEAIDFSGEFKKIEFKNVSFAYEKNTPVLQDVSLVVKRGESVALVGPSGSGKSTFISLIPRFYDATAGEICINDMPIKNVRSKSLRSLISLVSQETILFSGTIRENILYGKSDATEEDIVQAAKAANAHGFISAMARGYDTHIGEKGTKLSGGQRQRLSIARAIVKNPPILIFDEATSHLDSESEREVQTAIETLMQGRTVFVIAHRLSTIQRVDTILVLEAGRIIEQGRHEDLLGLGGRYADLYKIQFA
jgi:ATP-binding cassette, subfamily B, bacterial MsbA